MSNDNLKRGVRTLVSVDANTDDGKKEKDKPNSGEENNGEKDKLSQAKALLALAEGNCEFFHDERGDGYALVRDNDIGLTFKLSGKPFRTWLTGTFYKTKNAIFDNSRERVTLMLGAITKNGMGLRIERP